MLLTRDLPHFTDSKTKTKQGSSTCNRHNIKRDKEGHYTIINRSIHQAELNSCKNICITWGWGWGKGGMRGGRQWECG